MNIKDIARLAGVSISTVSRVLNDVPGVRPAVREEVRALISAQDYTPNRLARSLAARRSQTIGVILPHIHSYWMPRIAAVVDYFRELDYSVLISSHEKNPHEEASAFRVMEEKQVDGIIYFPHANNSQQKNLCRRYRDRLPLVVAEEWFEGTALDYVLQDNTGGTCQILTHLLQEGHTSLAVISGPPDEYSCQERMTACHKVWTSSGREWTGVMIREADFSMQGGFLAMQSLLRDPYQPPQAVFAFNDLMALGALKALHHAGLRVPEDVSLAGYDDIEWAEFSLPGLTTVKQEHYESGRQAALLLHDRIRNPHTPPRTIRIPQTLVIRDSTAARGGL